MEKGTSRGTDTSFTSKTLSSNVAMFRIYRKELSGKTGKTSFLFKLTTDLYFIKVKDLVL